MMVVEYGDRIVVVDCGLRFPTSDMLGIDLVLPDFSYLRERVEDIEAMVITHGHEDHLGALPWVLRELGQEAVPVVYGGQLTVAMARSKLAEHKLHEVNLEVLPIGDRVQAGPFELERIHLTHSIPDAGGVALTCPLGTILFTGDYKFDQTPVGGAPADMARLAEMGRERLLLLCGDSTNADRAGVSDSESIDRLYHIGCDVVTARDAPIHASGHGYAEELKMMLNLTRPQYFMPVHGDFKRMLLHSQLAEAVGVPGENIFRLENGTPLEIDADGARLGEPETAGLVFVDGVDIGDVADVALRDRRMLSGDGIFIIVATVSEQDGSSVVAPEVLGRGVLFLDGVGAFVAGLGEAGVGVVVLRAGL